MTYLVLHELPDKGEQCFFVLFLNSQLCCNKRKILHPRLLDSSYVNKQAGQFYPARLLGSAPILGMPVM